MKTDTPIQLTITLPHNNSDDADMLESALMSNVTINGDKLAHLAGPDCNPRGRQFIVTGMERILPPDGRPLVIGALFDGVRFTLIEILRSGNKITPMAASLREVEGLWAEYRSLLESTPIPPNGVRHEAHITLPVYQYARWRDLASRATSMAIALIQQQANTLDTPTRGL
jgi:hypothetical protein